MDFFAAQFLLPIFVREKFACPFTVAPILVVAGVSTLTISKAISVLRTDTDAVVVAGISGAVAGFVMGLLNIIDGLVFGAHQVDLQVFSMLVGIGITLFYTLIMGAFATLFGILYVKVHKARKHSK